MKSKLITVMLVMVLSAAADAAKTPPPASAHCRITCIVEQRAEWTADGQPGNVPPTDNSNPALLINSAPPSPTDSESVVEIDSNGQLHPGNSSIEIIISANAQSQGGRMMKTLTACWKI
jgi:hypothetical protein